jgi:mRNA-degrading endonuclease RelE of RelBE toxin-antitoxin system
MKVVKTRAVDVAVRTLSHEEQRKVFAWFAHLGNWETDELVRNKSKAMIYKDTFVLNTSDDIRIFFTLNEANNEIVIIDLAKPSRFEVAGMASE